MRRLATTLVFFTNGALFASVLPHLPTIKERAGLDDPTLGFVVAAASAGALLAGPLTGRLIRRLGAGPVAVTGTLVYCAALWSPAKVPSLLGLIAVFALFGVLDAVLDVAMNTMALAVQRAQNRPLINGFHAWWSIGAVAASGAAAFFTGIGIPMIVLLSTAGAVLAAGIFAQLPALWRQAGADDRPAAARPARPRPGHLVLLGAVALLVAFAEDVPSTWSAVYVEDGLGASAGLAAGAYVAFVSTMTAGRLINDRLVERFGAALVMRTQAAIFVAALVGVALSRHPAVAIAAFALAGLGVSILYPAVLAAAGAHREESTAGNLAFVTWVERLGFLIAPVMVGAVSGQTQLGVGILLGAVAGLLLMVLAGPLTRASSDSA